MSNKNQAPKNNPTPKETVVEVKLNKDTVLANEYDIAVKKAKEYGCEDAIPKTVAKCDSNHFNILLVSRVNNAAKQKYVTKTSIYKANFKSWEKGKENMALIGVTEAIVFHRIDSTARKN